MSRKGDQAYELVEVTLEASVPLPERVTETSISSLVGHVLASEQASGEWTIGFRMTSDVQMQTMHLEFMGLDSSTDIMTFPYEDLWREQSISRQSTIRGGDIVISIDRAREQAQDEGWDVADEVFFLVCHGILHLLDWDDTSDSKRVAMLDRQRELLSTWDRTTSW